MKKKIIVGTYQTIDDQNQKEAHYPSQYDFSNTYPSFRTKNLMTHIESSLPADINVFTELPKEVFELPEVGEMLAALRAALDTIKGNEVTLSKLRISEYTADGIVLDWIFNYFRVYFAFEFHGDDSFGMIANNPVENSFSSVFKEIKQDQYEGVAAEVVEFVLNRLNA